MRTVAQIVRTVALRCRVYDESLCPLSPQNVATERPATDRVGTDGSVLQFFDPETRRNLLTPMEAETDRRKAHADRDKAEAKSRQLEAELAELRARFGIP